MRVFAFIVLMIICCSCGEKTETIFVPNNNTAFLLNKNDKEIKSIEWLNQRKVVDSKVNILVVERQYGIMPGTTHDVPEQYMLFVDNNIQKSEVIFKVKNKENSNFVIKIEISYIIEKEDSSKFLYVFKTKDKLVEKINRDLNDKLKDTLKFFDNKEIHMIGGSLSNYIFNFLIKNKNTYVITPKIVEVKSIKSDGDFSSLDDNLRLLFK